MKRRGTIEVTETIIFDDRILTGNSFRFHKLLDKHVSPDENPPL